MGQVSLFIIAMVIIVVVFVLLISRLEAKRHGTSTKEEFVGICASAVETASQKEARKQKALAMFVEQARSTLRGASGQASSGYKELSNAEIRKALGVSSRTAVRYLDELEKEGKVEQVGKIGHSVTYRLK
ncbi:MAG: HTH domain-containing protein [bacterium]|nr:HTH domain-containing protein [bacterium]